MTKLLPSLRLKDCVDLDVHLTRSQAFALTWLRAHNGDGVFDRHGVALCAGESAPIMRSTWNALALHGLVEFYNPAGKGYGRLRLTLRGQHAEMIDEG